MTKVKESNHYVLQADKGKYITQIECLDTERVFATIALVSMTDTNWRDATNEEKEQWEREHPVSEGQTE